MVYLAFCVRNVSMENIGSILCTLNSELEWLICSDLKEIYKYLQQIDVVKINYQSFKTEQMW